MSTVLLMTNQERLAEIEEQLKKVTYQEFKITEFEMRVMGTLKRQGHGSHKQELILAGIERKIFGRSKALEPSKFNALGKRIAN